MPHSRAAWNCTNRFSVQIGSHGLPFTVAGTRELLPSLLTDTNHHSSSAVHGSNFRIKVIARATAYERLLMTLKEEYDDIIWGLQRGQDQTRVAQRCVAAPTSHSEPLITCRRQAARLRESLSLLQLLMEAGPGWAAVLSVGVACSTLLAGFGHEAPGLLGVLEEVILEDRGSSVEVWTHVASVCLELNRADLSCVFLSIMVEQSGTRVLSPDLEGVRLMEHVFL